MCAWGAAQAPKPLSLSTKRSSQRSVDIMLSAATLPSGAILAHRLTGMTTGMTSCSSTSSLEHTLSRQMSCFKLDWQARRPAPSLCRSHHVVALLYMMGLALCTASACGV